MVSASSVVAAKVRRLPRFISSHWAQAQGWGPWQPCWWGHMSTMVTIWGNYQCGYECLLSVLRGDTFEHRALREPWWCSNTWLLPCEHWLLSNSAHLSWIGWQQRVGWGLILGCSSGWQRLQGLKCRFARMGFSLQLEVENLILLGSILWGCRQTFPGPEHKWHWKHVWHHCAVTV